MVIKARNSAGQFTSYEDQFRIERDEQAGLVAKHIQLGNPVMPWAITELELDNVTMTYAQSPIPQDIILQTEQGKATVDVFLQLHGSSAIRRSGQASRFYGSGQCNLIHAPASEGELTLQGPGVSTFVAQFSPAFFTHFLAGQPGPLDQLGESIERGRCQPLAATNVVLTPAMRDTLQAMLHCPYRGLVKRLFLEGKLLELIALQLDQTDQTSRRQPTSLRGADVDKLRLVREWLDSNFLQPLTLMDVARQAGLNEFKLKKGFRELFHTTVFTYLTDLRLTHAKQLLLEGQRLVGEVADELGYSQVHHFTSAFKKRFGYLPRELRK